MQAIQYDKAGGPDVLHVADVPDVHPADGQVRVRVRASGVNPIDLKIQSGAMGPPKVPGTPGMELAGIVDEVGPGALFEVGAQVLGWSDTGSYAELALATQLVRKPDSLAWEVAAALPVAGDTANRVLDLLNIAAGETLLVHGGAGGVGSVAVQLAIRRGAKVIATASAANLDYLRELGATALVYGDGLVDRVRALGVTIDAVFDIGGQGALPASIELRGGTSRIVTIADMSAKQLGIPFSAGTSANHNLPKLVELAKSVSLQDVTVEIAKTFPLADAAKAQATLGQHLRGKVVLLVGH